MLPGSTNLPELAWRASHVLLERRATKAEQRSGWQAACVAQRLFLLKQRSGTFNTAEPSKCQLHGLAISRYGAVLENCLTAVLLYY